MDIEKSIDFISNGSSEILLNSELFNLFKKKLIIRIKIGFDPTSPDLHLGHFVLLNKIKQFQMLGYRILLILGDFTAIIGDPSGKKNSRKSIDFSEVVNNLGFYKLQIFNFLNNNFIDILFNSHWIKHLNFHKIIKLFSYSTVAKMLERKDFNFRYNEGISISIQEFIYPLFQAYDSVFINSDVEIGGVDQKFNLLLGRELQLRYKQNPQIVIMMPLLKGLDGNKKMSKSFNNCIKINDTSDNMFGKVMSVSDDLMWHYFNLLSFRDENVLEKFRNEIFFGANPRDFKIILAHEIVSIFHGVFAANIARDNFFNFFSKNVFNKIKLIKLFVSDNYISIINVLKRSSFIITTSEGFRLIKQGAVKIDGNKIFDVNFVFMSSLTVLIQVGKKKIAKISLIFIHD